MSYGQLTTTHEAVSETVPVTDFDRLCALLGDEWGPNWEPGTDMDLATEFPELAALADRSGHVPGVPDGLDNMAPGLALAAYLASIDVGDISGFDQVTVLRAHQRMASHYQARLYTAMAAVTTTFENEEDDPEPDVGFHTAAQEAAVEIGTALQLTRRAADNELGFALSLQRRLPRVHMMLKSGVIDTRRAKTIDAATAHLTTGVARNVVERIAEIAPELTTGQLRARIKKLCIEADPDDAQQRHDRAVTDRRVVMEPTLDGTCNLTGLDLPVVDATRAANRINTIARSLRRKGETRTIDRLRADVYLDLLTGRHSYPTTGRGTVHVTVDLDTLTALSEHPGELAGYGPVISDIARQIADESPDAEWRWTVTDTETGEPITTGITSRRPTAQMRRNIQTRDRHCMFPGCRMPSIESDLDHRVALQNGGPTSEHNLAPLCRFHHILKHHGWTTEKLTNGAYRWTSPLGRVYTTRRAPP
ncbi:MAG: DUF222 domain-containing protein [Actinobacteria bacterium]|nr:DUF222 domain-containing protein [Actinomycetota bacterium]